MNFNNISNDTKLRVRVPKALYESIQKELKKKSLNEDTSFYLVDKQNKTKDTVEAKDQEEAEKHFNNAFGGIPVGYIVTDENPENINEENKSEPLSFDISLSLKRIDDVIKDLTKVKETLLRIEQKG
jgi:hypothetical protein